MPPLRQPWEDVPIEVLIEDERKRQEQREQLRPRIYIPIPDKRPLEKKDKPDKVVIPLYDPN